MTSKSFSVRGYAQSSLLCVAELYGGTEEIGEDESGLRALAQAWKAVEGDRILVSVESAQAVAQGLNDYSNIEDAEAEILKHKSEHEHAKMARRASEGLSNLYVAVLRWHGEQATR